MDDSTPSEHCGMEWLARAAAFCAGGVAASVLIAAAFLIVEALS